MPRASLEAQTIQTNLAVIVQHAPNLCNGGVIQGSMQQLNGENVTINGGFTMTGDFLVPGTPTVDVRHHASYAGTIPGNGSTSPSGYKVVLDGRCSLNYLRTRTTPVTLPTVAKPPPPTGKRNVTISRPGQSYGNAATLLNLTLNGNVGLVSVPPGTYGNFTVNSGSGLIIGTAGAVQPAIYDLQNLTLSGNSTLQVVGPVILTVANGFPVNGSVGSSNNPAWLQLDIAGGDLHLNSGSIVDGLVAVPNGQVTIDRGAMLVGTSASANFTMNGNGLVRWGGNTQILPPTATNQTIDLAENSTANITLTGSDPQNLPLTYSVLGEPSHGVLSGTAPNLTYHPATNFYGDDSFTFDVSDGVTSSPPATISLVVTQVYHPPTVYSQSLTNLENTALPITLTGSDPQNYSLTYSVLTEPTHGTLSGTAPNLVYTPGNNYYGPDSFTFLANDGVSNSAPGAINITVEPVDQPPIVSAGSNQLIILRNNTVNLNGTVTYAPYPNTVDTVKWSEVSGPGPVTFSDAANTTTTATFISNGVYVLQLYASDSYLSASNTLKVTVDAPPVVHAGPEQTVNFGTVVTLSGVATDDGLPYNILDTRWSQASGPGTATFANPTLTNTTVTFDQAGVYELQLTADDGVATNSGDVTIQVHAVPIVFAGSSQVTAVGSPATLAGSYVDDGLAGPATSEWTQVSGPAPAAIANAVATNTTVNFSQDGVYVFELSVTDSLTNASAQVTVAAVAPPTVGLASSTLLINWPANQVTLNGTVTADGLPSGGTLTTAWSQISGPAAATLSSPVQSETLNGSPVSLPSSSVATFSTSGVYVFQLAATNQGGGAQSNIVVTVNQPPVVNAGPSQTVNFGTVVTLSGVATDDGLPYNILHTQWSEASGPGTATFANSILTNTTVTFDQAGVYDLRLTADDGAATNSGDVTIRVHAVPTVFAGSSQVTAVGSPVTLAGSYFDDGLAGPATSVWAQVSGPAPAVIANAAVTNTTVNFSQDGVYVFELSVTDTLTNASAQVTVSAVAPPTVTLATSTLLINWPANQATLNGTVMADGLPSGGTLTAAWSQISGPAAATLSSPIQSETLSGSPASFPSSSVATFSASGVYVFQFAATNQGGSAQSNIVVTVNQPPVVNAGPSQTVNFGTVVTLSGVATDDGLPYNVLHTQWSEASGPGTATFANSILTNTTVTFDQSGVYDLRLMADDGAATNSGDVTIRVHAVPMVFAGSNQVTAVGSPVTLAGSYFDDGLAGPATSEWTQVSGPAPAAIADAAATNTIVNFSQDGVYAFELSVTDSLTNASAQMTVAAVAPPAVGLASPMLLINWPANQVTLNGIVTADGLPSGGTLTATWSQLTGPAATLSDPPSQSETLNGSPVSLPLSSVATFNTSGVYVFQLAGANLAGTVQSNIVVTVNQPPVVNAGATQTNLFPATSQLSGTVTDDGLPLGGQLTWSWSVVSGPGTVTFNNAASTNAIATFSQPGLYILQLTASDTAAVSSNQVVIIEDTAPTVSLATNQVPAGTNQLTLTGTVTDDGLPPGAELTATWGEVSGPAAVAFNPAGQSSPLAGNPVTNIVQSTATFNMAGTYVLSLTANDSFAANSATISLGVASTPPIVSAGPDMYLSGVPATTTLNGQVRDLIMPLGGTLSQQWTVVGGPGTVTFGNPTSPVTTATFSTNGIYVLQLTASNGQMPASSQVEVRVETVCTVEDPEGLAAWWPADGNPEDVISGQQAIVNGTGYTNGEVGLAFNFDGTDDSLRVPGATNYDVGSSPSGLTIEFWMNPNSFQNGSVLGFANSIRVEREAFFWAGSTLRCYLGSGGQYVQAPGNVWNNTAWGWTHIAVTYDKSSGMADMYIDGSIVATAVVGTNLLSTTNDFYMGEVPGSADAYSGQLDEISLYRRPLNPEEVYNIYASGSVGKCPYDTNAPPMVSAGPDLFLTGVPATTTLNGQVSDPVLPAGGTLSQQWSVVEGPGPVIFGSQTSPVTTAMFNTNGIYVLQLTANNGEQETSSLVEVRVESLCTVQDPEGLAAWWPADGTAEDVVSGNSAILGGSTSYTKGEVALAFNFDGLDDFVWVPSAPNYNVGASPAGLTLEFWMNPNSMQSGSVLGWANSIRVERENGNWTGSELRCYLGSGGQYVQTGNVWNNTAWGWTHVAVTYDKTSGEADLYINGSIAASADVGTNLLSTTNDIYMGEVPGSPNFYSGQLDEISLYSRPLNPEEVYNIYASGSIGKCPDTNTLAVYAGSDFAIPSATNSAVVTGSVTENGQVAGSDVQVQWTEYYGPAPVTFGNPTSVSSPVTFSANGIYVLQLSANNGDEVSSGLVEVRVGVPCDDIDLSGLSAWWPANGTAEDVIGGNEAILGGGTSYTNGEVATAFNFDGVDDFVWAPAATNYNVGTSTSGMTIEFWMNPNSLQNGSVLGWANSIRVEREAFYWAGSTLRCYLGTGGQYVQAPGNVWNDTTWGWTHVAVTYDATNGVADMYINGSLAASASVGMSLMSTTNDFYMGQVPGSANSYSGQLDEISLYNRPLSAADISAIYTAGSAGKCPQ